MRVLLINNHCISDPTAGVVRSLRTLARWLVEAGHPTRVLTTARFEAPVPFGIEEHLASLGVPLPKKFTRARPWLDYHLDGGDPSVLSSTEFPDPDQRARMAEGRQVVEGADDLLTVIAADRRGLFSRVAGVLAIHGLQVRSADAASADGMAIEQFRVSSPTGTTIPWDRVVPQLDAAIAERLAIEARLADRVRTYRDREPSVRLPPPTVRFDDAASRVATVVEIHAPDRTGLLYRVTRTFADFGIDVTVAKVQTLGDVVVDAFYLQHPDGSLVTDPALRRELERAVLHAVT